jgi:hypothetical protein
MNGRGTGFLPAFPLIFYIADNPFFLHVNLFDISFFRQEHPAALSTLTVNTLIPASFLSYLNHLDDITLT